jgi:two-component system sensor histidine kinase RegB
VEPETGGLGLGFFIAKTLLERSGALLSCINRPLPQSGAVVQVRWARVDFEKPAGTPDLPGDLAGDAGA